MDQSQRDQRTQQLPLARTAVLDLFNVYLGRNICQKIEDDMLDAPNKMQKRIKALRVLPPRDEQFLFDFEQLQRQFPDQEQLRATAESVIVSLAIQCSDHAQQAEFILFSVTSLANAGYLNWETLVSSFLSSLPCIDSIFTQNSQVGSSTPPTATAPSSIFQHSSPAPASPLVSTTGISSPAQSGADPPITVSPTKLFDGPSNTSQIHSHLNTFPKAANIGCLCELVSNIIKAGLHSILKPSIHAEIFVHMLSWVLTWCNKQANDEAGYVKGLKHEKASFNWVHGCVDVIQMLVEEEKCRVPFYELIRSGLRLTDDMFDSEALFSIMLEVDQRRDKVAMHMQMLDQHLHCPTFGTHRFLSQSPPNISGEPAANLRYSPITYAGILGEPLHGEDIAIFVQRGSLDWERALRCLRHALHATPSPDWWRRVLTIAPCYRSHAQHSPTAGAVFTHEMICESLIDRILELLNLTNADNSVWQDWLIFEDVFFFLMKAGSIDFIDFLDKLQSRVVMADSSILKSNHVTWLLAQVIRQEIVTNILSTDPQKVEITRKILSFHKDDKNTDLSNSNPQSMLLDFISSSQTLRIWSFNSAIREYLNNEQLQKGKQIDEWWKQVSKGEHVIDYANLDDRSMGMFWVLSYTMAQPAREALMNWLTSGGVTELYQSANLQHNERVMIMRESCPLPMTLLSGLSINLCQKLASQIEETLFLGQVVPSIGMVETYVRLLLVAPYSMFRLHFNTLTQKSSSILGKPGVSLLLLEILNYRLFPLYRYHGKSKSLMYDVTKLISMLKAKRGEHRQFRLAENLCMNLIFSIRDFFLVKKEFKAPTDFTETLNRLTVISLAITIKTRGLAELEHIFYFPSLLEQIMASSQHIWSEKTLRHFPPVLRESLMGRIDKRAQAIQAWQQAETTVINQCTQLLSPSADPTYVMTYISHSFPQHRQYLCAGAWMLMTVQAESINTGNLGRVLREFSPEEVTSNIYTMVDVLLHHMQIELQHGHLLQELLMKACSNLVFLIWTHELLPLDILILALIDRDDDPHALHIALSLLDRQELQQRIKIFCSNRGQPEHWLHLGPFKRTELQKALGSHLSWKERYPPFFDDIAARMVTVIPLVIYRLVEHDLTDMAEKVLALYSPLLEYHPLRFTFVRDILAYFYGHLPSKLIMRILGVLDIPKVPFSESFPQHIGSSGSAIVPPADYFANLLLGIVNNVIPLLNNKIRCPGGENNLNSSGRAGPKSQQSSSTNGLEGQRMFFQNQDPGTYPQLILETAVIEILSLPWTACQVVSTLVQVVVHVQPTLLQSSIERVSSKGVISQAPAPPSSPSGGNSDSTGTLRSGSSSSGLYAASFLFRSGYTPQQLSCLMIQACGLLLAQLPPDFHVQLYLEASRIIKDCWWISDGERSASELNAAVRYALMDPTWAAQDNTATVIGNVVALLHAFFSNLPQEWLEGSHTIIKNLRPVATVAMLRVAFRIITPLFPRLIASRPLFMKTLALLFNIMAEVFGRNSQLSCPNEASEVVDIIDFLHHVVMYEGQGGPVQSSSKPKLETLTLCSKVMEMLRPDIQHLLSHLTIDMNSSIYAATHPKLTRNT